MKFVHATTTVVAKKWWNATTKIVVVKDWFLHSECWISCCCCECRVIITFWIFFNWWCATKREWVDSLVVGTITSFHKSTIWNIPLLKQRMRKRLPEINTPNTIRIVSLHKAPLVQLIEKTFILEWSYYDIAIPHRYQKLIVTYLPNEARDFCCIEHLCQELMFCKDRVKDMEIYSIITPSDTVSIVSIIHCIH